MKYVLLCLFAFFVSTNTVAQTFSLTELLRLRTLAYPEFESAVTQKGYQYVDTGNDENSLAYAFGFNEQSEKSSRYISYNIMHKDKNIFINYQTSLQSDYEILKRTALDMGFIYVETRQMPEGKGVHSFYIKGSRQIEIYTTRRKNPLGNFITAYGLSVY